MTLETSIHAAINRYVEAGELAGAAALVWRDGHVVQTVTVGKRDLQSDLPIERSTIFRIASMTKPVTAAVALMLHDAGRFDLDDPITVCAPEFTHMRVLRDSNGPLDQSVDAVRPITFRSSPLGMRDTGFVVPRGSRDRRARLCGFDNEGRLTTLSAVPGQHALDGRPDDMTLESGGQGLWSTLDDYLAFARMLIGEGPRLLRPQTLAMMTTNQLTPAQRANARMMGQALFAKGHGYGMGVAVVMEPEDADPMRCRGGVGTIGWPGAYGGWWQADPNDRSVLIFLAHNMVELRQMTRGIGLTVWSAITAFHEIGTSPHR